MCLEDPLKEVLGQYKGHPFKGNLVSGGSLKGSTRTVLGQYKGYPLNNVLG